MRFLLGVLNSSTMNRYFKLRFPANNHIASNQLSALLIPEATVAEEQRIGKLVDAVMETNEQLLKSGAEHEKEQLRKRGEMLDHQIDRAVCLLFGLPGTPE